MLGEAPIQWISTSDFEADGKRFGSVEAVLAEHWPEFLGDNSSAYMAADARAVACFQAHCVGGVQNSSVRFA